MTDILIIGEAWGKDEFLAQEPFVGTSGQELTRMLSSAGINRSDCFLTNVFNIHPPGNEIGHFTGDKVTALPGYPPLFGKRYVQRGYARELERLRSEITRHRPNVCVCLGNTAMWALLGKSKIGQFRGATELSSYTVKGIKCLPTYHPAAVVRDWGLRPTVVLDLRKAKRQSTFPEARWPERVLWIEPTLEDLDELYQRCRSCGLLSVDIETSGNRITTIGFSTGPGFACIVPFYDPRATNRCYWKSDAADCQAWDIIRGILKLPCRKLFQNGLYDIAFLWRAMGLRVANVAEDSMLLHHALQPESLKSLGYLGSIYTDERAWKSMRSTTTIKQDA